MTYLILFLIMSTDIEAVVRRLLGEIPRLRSCEAVPFTNVESFYDEDHDDVELFEGKLGQVIWNVFKVDQLRVGRSILKSISNKMKKSDPRLKYYNMVSETLIKSERERPLDE